MWATRPKLAPGEQVNKDIQDLRTHTNAPDAAVRQAEQNANQIVPEKKPD